MLTEADIEECISRAYVYAVAGRAGVNLSGPIKDYGTDGTFRDVQRSDGRRFESGWSIDFQLKASKNCGLEESFVVFDLEADTYRQLLTRRDNGAIPIVLILMALPKDVTKWLVHTEDVLELRHCCYWWRVEGDWSDNTASVRIRIPRTQQLNPESLVQLLKDLKDGSLQ
jgi:hypothetical protein